MSSNRLEDVRGKPLLTLVAAASLGAAVGAWTMKIWSRREKASSIDGASSSHRVKAGELSRRNYETSQSARQYLEFHYTPSATSFAQPEFSRIEEAFDFSQRLAKRCSLQRLRGKKNASRGKTRALDLGCAAGAMAFWLSKEFEEVVGVDLSTAFIADAEKLRKNGTVEFTASEQGERGLRRVATLPDGANPQRCQFYVGDALEFNPSWGKFDMLLAANLVCRVPKPRQLLQLLKLYLSNGGIVVLVSPYSWWDGATPREQWIGGKEGDPPSEASVKEIMVEQGYKLLEEGREPFLLRDHVRRYQLGFSHCTVWQWKE